MSSIIPALISSGVTIIITVITVITSASKTRQSIETNLAVQEERMRNTETRISELASEVREHNNYGRQIPVMCEQIKVINHRLDDLEQIERRRANDGK